MNINFNISIFTSLNKALSYKGQNNLMQDKPLLSSDSKRNIQYISVCVFLFSTSWF